MSDLLFTIWMLIKLILVFILIFFIFPSRILVFKSEAKGFLDKIFINLIVMTLLLIIIVHTLVFLKLYDFISLVFSLILTYIITIRIKGKSWSAVVDALGMKVITKLLDTADNNKGFFDSFKSRLKNWINNVIKHFRVFFLKAVKDPFYFILPFAVILAAAFIRFKNSIIHASYSHIDVYSQLLNIKYLGINEIYHNGIYPFGYHSVISAISKLSFVDPYWVSRFIGPMVGLFMVLSVYYVTLKLTGSRIASLIPLVIYSPSTPARIQIRCPCRTLHRCS